jgi:hypothetical protein
MPAPPRAAVWDGGARSLPLDGDPSPQPAIPGGVLSSRARVRFAGRVEHRCLLLQGQVACGVSSLACLGTALAAGLPGLGELAVALGPDGLGSTLELVEGRDVADGAVEPHRVVVLDEGGDQPPRVLQLRGIILTARGGLSSSG